VIWYLILDFVQDTASLLQLTNSSEKLAELFTPRSHRHAEAKLTATNSSDDKQSDIGNSVPVRRQSSRLSAKAAADAIAKAAADAAALTSEVTTDLHVMRKRKVYLDTCI
jgi:hypothetical protein